MLDHAQCGHLDCAPEERPRGASPSASTPLTFTNDLKLDLETLEAYNDFRAEAERKGFRHFREVFNPNVAGSAVSDELRPQFINDVIARTLAGVATAGRPVFLKIAYQGPKAMEELVAHDPHSVVGVLGGAVGTTLDAFALRHEARKHGARAALFGRKINRAENQLALHRVPAAHRRRPHRAGRGGAGVRRRAGEAKIRPHRPLEEDLTLQTNVASYAGSEKVTGVPKKPASAASTAALADLRTSPR